MTLQHLTVECASALSLRHTVTSHGWVNLAPWRWDDERGQLSRRDRLSSGATVDIRVTQDSPHRIVVNVEARGLEPAGLQEVRAMVVRWLSIDWDPRQAIEVAHELDPDIATFIQNGGGRLLRCSSFFEDFVKTVCTIHAAWSATRRMTQRLVDTIGDGLFPRPTHILEAGEATLRGEARLGFRAPVLLEVTEGLLERGLMDELGHGAEDRITYEELIRLRGIGPYAASHMAMLLHDFSRIPVDSVARRFCREHYGIASDEIEALFERWGRYRALGYRIARTLARQKAAGY